jgi:signal transduction histidine kinase
VLESNIELDQKIIAFDPNRIERVILNLLSNAVKFTEPEDIITISLYMSSDNESVCISVRDTGLGMEKDKQEQIFEKFSQIDEGNGGSGMGLSIVKYLVEMHGGEIILNSEYGEGSEFIVILPTKILSSTKVIKNKDNSNPLNKINIEFADIYN